jgi:indole-3-glycerol phosphate synthase
MRCSAFALLLLVLLPRGAWAFETNKAYYHAYYSSPSSSKLHAIGVLAKKAKQAQLRQYVESGVEDAVMKKYNEIRESILHVDVAQPRTPGPLQQELTKRRGTITVIAEYKRKNDQVENGFISEMYDPEILSPTFREFGASGIAVMADERMGGCSYLDLQAFCEEQRRSQNQVPGPVAVINNDLIIDELQIARTAACGAQAVVLTLSVVGEQQLPILLRAAAALDLEAIVSICTAQELQTAVGLGARMVLVNVDGVEGKTEAIQGLTIPEGEKVCLIANIIAKKDRSLQEIEEAWAVRDKGFNCAWIGDGLYKSGALETEHPGAIIRSMKSKSSLRWASPKASSGRGEGAREYLGDILM